jgi:hypothetical protein
LRQGVARIAELLAVLSHDHGRRSEPAADTAPIIDKAAFGGYAPNHLNHLTTSSAVDIGANFTATLARMPEDAQGGVRVRWYGHIQSQSCVLASADLNAAVPGAAAAEATG